MKLNPKEFKRFKELIAKSKSSKLTGSEQAELDELSAKKNEKGSNAVEWWKNYPALLKDVTNLPFNWIPGTRVEITGFQNLSDTLRLGVIAIAKMRPGIGVSSTDADAFNSQIRQLWLDLHRRYRGIGAYEKADLGITILAIEAAFEALAKFERIYGVINTYHIGNRNVPYGLKEALGISNDLEENLAEFRYTLNLYITKMKQLCLPKGLSNLMADVVAAGSLFKDSENERAFIFGFDPEVVGYYDATSLTTGGCVKYQLYTTRITGLTPGNRVAFTLADINSILNDVVSRLLNDDDISKMCSDLLAAYGPENVMTLVEVPEDYTVQPVHDYERSLQFHNMTICNGAASIYEDSVVDTSTAGTFMSNGFPIVIYQNNNTVMCRLGISDDTTSYALVSGLNYPCFDATAVDAFAKEADVIFDTWVDNPGEAEIVCGTRYTSLCDAPQLVSSNIYRQNIAAFGTKVVTRVEVFRALSGGVYANDPVYSSIVPVSSYRAQYNRYLALMQLDWHPTLYIEDASNVELFGDVDNFTVINAFNLHRIHEVALLSGYKIPMVASHD